MTDSITVTISIDEYNDSSINEGMICTFTSNTHNLLFDDFISFCRRTALAYGYSENLVNSKLGES